MKTIFGDCGSLTLQVEDGRDVTWLNEFLLNINKKERGILGCYISVSFKDGFNIDGHQARGITVREAIEIKKDDGNQCVWGIIDSIEIEMTGSHSDLFIDDECKALLNNISKKKTKKSL